MESEGDKNGPAHWFALPSLITAVLVRISSAYLYVCASFMSYMLVYSYGKQGWYWYIWILERKANSNTICFIHLLFISMDQIVTHSLEMKHNLFTSPICFWWFSYDVKLMHYMFHSQAFGFIVKAWNTMPFLIFKCFEILGFHSCVVRCDAVFKKSKSDTVVHWWWKNGWRICGGIT